MNSQKRRGSLGEGVYFAPEDYVGIGSRLVILIVDCLVLAFVLALFDAVAGERFDTRVVLAYFGFVWVYLTIIKASKIRTVGYWVTGSKILNLRGQSPSVFRMTIRLILLGFWGLIPYSLLYDLLWAGVDGDHQTLRDRYAGTCVVRNRALPLGTREIHLEYYTALGHVFIYPRVKRPPAWDRQVPAKSELIA